jgi:tRNA-2-methylthio-N6-dimethylallyladenosine synthase
MNKLDTALVASALKEAGFSAVDDMRAADVVLINTCSVRQHAEDRVLSLLGNLKHIKETRSEIIVGVIGCMAQRLGESLLEHEAVNFICGPGQIPLITQLVTDALEQRGKSCSITEDIRQSNGANPALEDFESVYDSDDKAIPSQAYVRAMRGCNNFCSYCVVPYVRGPETSRPAKSVIEQIKRLADEGIKQVTLLGQAVNKYKYSAGDKTYFLTDLLEMASGVDGIEWIRFVTNYPKKENFEQLCRAMADLPKVCMYLHMPAQSGSDKILEAMNRHYTAEEYLGLLEKARDIVQGIAVAGDFIVGFPGESEEDFEATVDLVKKARYKNCFVFKYSPRPGTNADCQLADTVPLEIKKKRNNELLAVQAEISDQLSKKFLGKTVKVLVEGLSKKPHLNASDGAKHPQLVGRTATDWIVVFNGPENLAGKFVKVKITNARPLTLFGKMR